MEPVKWRKSERSGDQGDACVELAHVPNGVGVRDSKNPAAGHLTLTPHAFRTLLTNLKR
ncbi:DUF397 domain-containing protein [Actinomadura darangshiensis]|uniref:DUF397 domain-containing protein n=1 Tax=Actinomadura darangshiensis TaxID=705336 RepID=A0A4R5AC94_9ACTN|nr:DUF397 domain-containing protein [Actinomadura darangshiensis]TDD68856.1 DUF397 domain-containing protein [Actinomadura darangshiensis]